MKKFRLVLLCLIMLLPLCAAAGEASITFSAGNAIPDMVSVSHDGEKWIFLPSFADWNDLSFTVEGYGTVSAGALAETDDSGIFAAALTAGDGSEFPVKVMQSSGLRTVFLISSDPEEHGREWIEEEGQKHTNTTTGEICVVDSHGNVDYAGELESLRGRGNGSWDQQKKPYQIKLKKKDDLMQTGEGKQKTYTLLSMAQEQSLIRNRVWLDLGRELGVEETPFTEPVDLYYDGRYRGSYVLCEKVQVKKNRIEGRNYDDLISEMNPETDLSSLPVETGTTPDGRRMTYIGGLPDVPDVHAATWYTELDNALYVSDPCSIQIVGDRFFSVKTPEFAPKNLMDTIADTMDRLLRTMENHGIDPVSGRTLEQQIHMDQFAAQVLLIELGNNYDGLGVLNGYFVMHEGDDRLSTGPIWDMDLIINGNTDKYRENHGWLQNFYSVPAFRDEMKDMLENRLEHLLMDVILGDEISGTLRPLRAYMQQIASSWQMDAVLWNRSVTFEDEITSMEAWLRQRWSWLKEQVTAWNNESADQIDLWAEARYTLLDTTFATGVMGYSNADMQSSECEMVSEADEESYAVWSYSAVITPAFGLTFENPEVRINGVSVPAELQEDGSLLVTAVFEDTSYRYVDYDGMDIGYIYDEAAFRKNYPDLSEEYGDDTAGLMAYFMEEGLQEGLQGNAYFSGKRADQYMGMHELFGDSLEEYYYQFMDYGYDDWMQSMPVTYEPPFRAE